MNSTVTDSAKIHCFDNKSPQTIDPTELVNDHADYLYRFAYSRMRDASAAEDVVQETILVALRSGGTFSQKSSLRSWLTGILRHKIIDHFRRTNRQLQLDCDELNDDDLFDESGAWRSGSAPVNWGTSEHLFEQKEFMLVLEECISELPRNLGIAFTLREIEGFSSDEICEILNISAGNLSVIMHRARLRLRQSLERKWFAQGVMSSPVPALVSPLSCPS